MEEIMLFDYDNKKIESIYKYAKELEDKTFRSVEEEYDHSPFKSYDEMREGYGMRVREESFDQTYGEPEKDVATIPSEKAKGQLGNFLETHYFGYAANGKQEADFSSVGLELKATPIDIGKNGMMRAGERLSITNISYTEPVIDNFYDSHVWEKLHRILLIQYIRDKTKDRMDYIIKFVNLFTPSPKDQLIIENDYQKINEKIKLGLAHELSEGDTMYLGACTKGSTAQKSWRPQYYGEHILAKKRNYCLKQSYMNYVLNEYVLKGKVPYDNLIERESVLKEKSFEEILIEKIDKYKGKSDEELCTMFSRPYNNNKAQWIELSNKMLGIKGNHAEELMKAGIKVKAIRIEANGHIKESMPLPNLVFKELVKQDWYDSDLYDYLENQKYLFVVFKKIGSKYHLIGAQLWNMPQKDIEEKVKPGWEKIKDRLLHGVEFIKTTNKKGKLEIKNNLLKKTENEVIHIRSHAAKAAYRLNDGTVIGELKHADQLPDGQWMTKQSMWINNDYLLSQLKVK